MTDTVERSDDGYDVVVVGGGAAGVAAACGAAAAGARTLLLERTSVLGGAATLRNVLGYCGLWTCEPTPKKAVGGIADQILDHLRSLGGVTDMTILTDEHYAVVFIDPESLKRSLDLVCVDHGVDVRLGATLVGVHRDGDRIHSLDYRDFAGNAVTVSTRAVVDTTGDATVTALSGSAVTIGAAGRTQTATMAARYGGIGRDADVSMGTFQDAIRRARDAGEPNLTSATGLVSRLPVSGDVITYLADEDLDPLQADSYTSATRHGREQAWAYLRVLRTLAGCESAYLISTGPELGIRQSRHLVSRTPLLDSVLRIGTVSEDTVALAAWPSEYHPGSGRSLQWETIGGDGAFGITIDNVRSVDTVNLFGAGRVLSGDRIAGASVRVMGTAMATGHAAGVAAALLPTSEAQWSTVVRDELTRQGAILHL